MYSTYIYSKRSVLFRTHCRWWLARIQFVFRRKTTVRKFANNLRTRRKLRNLYYIHGVVILGVDQLRYTIIKPNDVNKKWRIRSYASILRHLNEIKTRIKKKKKNFSCFKKELLNIHIIKCTVYLLQKRHCV